MLTNPSILIIDDNKEVLEALGLILKAREFNVSVKYDPIGPDFLLCDHKPDLIVPDKFLGWADGVVVCRQIKSRELFNEVPIIMYSGHHKSREECMTAGADAFIEKPFTIKDLLTHISMLLSAVHIHT